MELTRVERWTLANQYKILELLDPDRAAEYETCRIALECAYELSYETCANNIYEKGLFTGDCEEVLDILNMFRILKQSVEKLSDKTGIDLQAIHFDGFDGNNETKQLTYAEFFCKRYNRFEELNVCNSHSQVLGGYQRMRREWELCEDKYNPTKEEIIKIAKARFPNR